MTITAETLTMAGGVAAFLLTISWVRARDLREKYAPAWLAVATLLLLIGLFPDLLKEIARTAHLSEPATVLFLALALIYPFAFFVTVTMSRQYRRQIRLVQEIALLERRVRELESRLTTRP
jgi:hypothetical protein